jgi:hypothetical protein
VTFFQRAAIIVLIFFGAVQAHAQFRSATITGTVTTDDGRGVPDARVQFIRSGQTVTLTTDSAGRFRYYFATPGIHSFRFEHDSVLEVGAYEGVVNPGSSLDLRVVLNPPGNGTSETWRIEARGPRAPDLSRPEKFLSQSYIQSLPSSEHVWSLLNMTEPSVVTEYYDAPGFKSGQQFLMGVRGSSWSQNQGLVNGQSVTHPSGDGMLVFPDMSSMEGIVYDLGDSPNRHSGPGAHIEFIPKAGQREPHGQAQFFLQNGALQNVNVTDRERSYLITQSDERWKYFLNGGFQLGGPVGKQSWTYFTSISARDYKKWIRNNEPLPIAGALGQETFHLSGQVSPKDTLSFYGSFDQRYEPQAEASPQVTRESSVDEHQQYYFGQASWTRTLSNRSLLDARFGVARSNLHSGFQRDAQGQSTEDLFAGFVIDGYYHRLPPPGAVYEWLNNTRRGPAPLISSFGAQSTEASFAYSTVREGFWNSSHRLSAGGSYHWSSLSESQDAIDGVNLLIFEEFPNSLRLLNTPARTRDHVGQFEFYGSETVSFSRLSFMFGVSADSTRGGSSLQSNRSINAQGWTNAGGKFGAAFQLMERHPFVFRTGVAKIYDSPTVTPWTASNPESLGVRLYRWNDANGDARFQPGENTQLLKVTGGPYTRLDPNLQDPRTSEFTIGFSQSDIGKFGVDLFGFRRSTQRLMSLVNEGVPFSAYTPVPAVDPGADGVMFTGDDAVVTVYNQSPETLGKDRYVLTNPPGFSSHSEGFELKLRFTSSRTHVEAVMTRYRAVAATAPGIFPRENDTSVLLGVYDNPNNAIFARGSSFFDRGTLGRLQATTSLPFKMRIALLASYQDGLPYARILPVLGLNQGVIGVLITQRGSGEAGSQVGPMTTHYETFDVRLSRNFEFKKKKFVGTLDVFNALNMSQLLLQTYITSKTQQWRVPLRFQAPRSIQLGIRHTW